MIIVDRFVQLLPNHSFSWIEGAWYFTFTVVYGEGEGEIVVSKIAELR